VTPRSPAASKASSITTEAGAANAASAAAAAAPRSESSRGATTEADFKSVAQAAVTNLILNAGTTSGKVDGNGSNPSVKVDTSTAHIKALTSPNWVTACSGPGGSNAANAAAQAAADAKANRARRQNLTPDERARQNRDRNREHARNTRLRKKAYVEELKSTLLELVIQRDGAEEENRQTAQRELEQREVRFRVMEEFLKLRGRNEASLGRWAAILEDGFTFTLPVTTFRKMAGSASSTERAGNPHVLDQVLKGTNEVMLDADNMSSFLQTLGDENVVPATPVTVSLSYQCDRKNFFMDSCTGVLTWTATSVGAMKKVCLNRFGIIWPLP
jgi:hypothetical protein